MRSRITASRSYKVRNGAVLAQTLTGTWTNGNSVQVEAATDFSPSGGDGYFKASPDSDTGEYFTYGGIEINGSDNPATPDLLTGVQRNSPTSHAKGTWVQEGEKETVEKHVDGFLDGHPEPVSGVPVDPTAYTLIELGVFAEADMPVLPVDIDDTGNALVTGGAAGAVPLVGSDIETLPGTGDGTGEVDPDTGNPPPGQGWEDGEPPATAPTLTAVGGVGFISLRATAIENGSAVTYKFYGHTSSGFTEDDTKFIGSVRLSGESGFLPSLTVRDFPTGHTLDGGANDPVKQGVTYYFTCVPYDGSGAGPVSNEVSATPVLIETVDIDLGAITEDLIAAGAVTETKIEDNSISTPKLIAGAVTAVKIGAGEVTAVKIAAGAIETDKLAANAVTSDKIAANTIVAGDIASGTITATQIAGSTITADKLSVSTLSAISANIGTVTAGNITGLTITGGTIKTASSGRRIEMSASASEELNWYNASNGLGLRIYLDSSDVGRFQAASKVRIACTSSAGEITIGDSLDAVGFFDATPVTQRSDPGDHSTTTGTDSDGNARAKINDILSILRDYGLI